MKAMFKCEKCCEAYEDQEECLSCEAGHAVPIGIVDYGVYSPEDIDVPLEVTLEMSDGTKAVYLFSYSRTQELKNQECWGPSILERFVNNASVAIKNAFGRSRIER